MNKRKITAVFVMSLLFCFQPSQAGDLNPTSPPAPTMKTLDQVEPRIPIHADDLPLTISKPGSYYFAEPITYTGAGAGTGMAAISIESDDVTIDLNGFTLDGKNNTYSTAGIFSNTPDKISVKNGRIIRFNSYGVYLAGEGAENNNVEDLVVSASENPIVLGNSSSAIRCKVSFIENIGIRTGMNCIVDSCIVYYVLGSVETRGGIYCMDYSIIRGCAVKDCPAVFAIKANSHCLVENNIICNSVVGIVMNYGSTARNNQINGCATGITTNNDKNIYHRALIEGNFIDDTSYGIEVGNQASVKNNSITAFNFKGIVVKGNCNSIDGNTIFSTSAFAVGIEVEGDNNLYIDNRLSNTAGNIVVTGSGNTNGGGNVGF